MVNVVTRLRSMPEGSSDKYSKVVEVFRTILDSVWQWGHERTMGFREEKKAAMRFVPCLVEV